MRSSSKTKNAVLFFALSLNVVLAASLGFLLVRNMKESRERELLAEATKVAQIDDCRSMLSRAAKEFSNGRKDLARITLKNAQFVGCVCCGDYFSELAGMTDWYFFSGEIESDAEDDFIVVLGALDAMLEGREFSSSENEISERIRAAYACLNFEVNNYPYFSSFADADIMKIKKKAAALLGKHVAISECANTQFPLRYTYAGGNTFSSMSVQGGKLIEMFFYTGESDLNISEEEALQRMKKFLKDEQFPDMVAKSIVSDNGIYYAVFALKKNEDLTVKIAVRGESGRVCFFDAESFYENYKKR